MNTKYLDIIIAPVITEKSATLSQESERVFSFYVDPRSNKTEIKLAIEKIFNVTVEEIRTINVHPKRKRVGKHAGWTNKKKKAIVKLAEGQTIEMK